MLSESEKNARAAEFVASQEEKGNMLPRGATFSFSIVANAHVTLLLTMTVTDQIRADADAILAARKNAQTKLVKKIGAFIAAQEKAGGKKFKVGDPINFSFKDDHGIDNTILTSVNAAMRPSHISRQAMTR